MLLRFECSSSSPGQLRVPISIHSVKAWRGSQVVCVVALTLDPSRHAFNHPAALGGARDWTQIDSDESPFTFQQSWPLATSKHAAPSSPGGAPSDFEPPGQNFKWSGLKGFSCLNTPHIWSMSENLPKAPPRSDCTSAHSVFEAPGDSNKKKKHPQCSCFHWASCQLKQTIQQAADETWKQLQRPDFHGF